MGRASLTNSRPLLKTLRRTKSPAGTPIFERTRRLSKQYPRTTPHPQLLHHFCKKKEQEKIPQILRKKSESGKIGKQNSQQQLNIQQRMYKRKGQFLKKSKNPCLLYLNILKRWTLNENSSMKSL